MKRLRLSRPGLRARLVIVMVLMAMTVVVLDTTLTRWAFQTRFLTYVNEQEQEVAQRLSLRLGQLYDEQQGWEGLAGNRRLLGRLLLEDLREDGSWDWRDGPPPPEQRERLREGLREDLRSTRRLLFRLYVTDVDGQPVIGPRGGLPTDARPHETAITMDGREIGRVVLLPLHALDSDIDRRFVDDHMRTMWWIALAALILASLVGMALARYLLAPVRAITAGARELAQGHYHTRLDDRRGDELGALARDFNLLAAGLESSRESRRRWLADVAHELRTPLAVLRAEIEALRDGIRPLDGAAMDALAGEAERLGRLVDDLHQLSLADAGALSYHFAALDPLALLASSADRFHGRMQQAGLRFEVDLPASAPQVMADGDRLQQLMANLLENSLRYTRPPGPVRLSLEPGRDWVTILVDDGPPGVAQAEIPALFERFTRRELARDRASGGSGLGLAIARRIAEAHGGSLDAMPSALGGLRLRLLLPVAAAGAKS